MKKDYRKIWSNAYGEIPKDDKGRSYDIHHINGNHNDNRLENLKAVSIQEHYDIHSANGDTFACQKILFRMKVSPEIISKQCSELMKKAWADPNSKYRLRAYKTHWQNQYGEKNHNYDNTTYRFAHETGKEFIGTFHAFRTTYQLHRANVRRLINGDRKTAYGWRYLGTI